MRDDARETSLRSSIFLITLVATLFPVLGTSTYLNDLVQEEIRGGLELKARSLVAVLGGNLAAAIEFDDRKVAEEVISSTAQDADLAYVLVLKRDGSVFASLQQERSEGISRPLQASTAQLFYEADLLNITHPVKVAGKQAGTVQLGFVQSRVREAQRHALFAVALSALVLIIVVVLAQMFGLERKVVRPVQTMTSMAKQLASGNLRAATEPAGNDEIARLGRAINEMASVLRDQVGAIKQASGSVLQSARGVDESTVSLSAAAGQQAASIQETTVTIEQVRQTGKLANDGASAIVDVSERTGQISEEGRSAVETSVQDMRAIRDQIGSLVGQVDGLRRRLGEVAEVIEAVNSIAEQSNLLSVNASIEAAKAGEFGRGFAVVAQEVKALAHASKKATAQAKQTLGSIQKGIELVVEQSRASQERTEAGVKSIEHTGEVIDGLARAIQQATAAARSIAVAANDQVVGFDQIALTMSSINRAAQENMGSSRNLRSNSQSLEQMARRLETLVSRYEV